jgi:hypothetical protein
MKNPICLLVAFFALFLTNTVSAQFIQTGSRSTTGTQQGPQTGTDPRATTMTYSAAAENVLIDVINGATVTYELYIMKSAESGFQLVERSVLTDEGSGGMELQASYPGVTQLKVVISGQCAACAQVKFY